MTTHAEEGALLRWIDGECDADERVRLNRHLAGCPACNGRVADLRDWTARFDMAVRAAGRTGTARRRVRWAVAAAVLLVGAALVVEPVRAWVLDRVDAAWSAVTGRVPGDVPARSGTVEDAPAPATTSITFAPTSNVFRLEVATRQARGHLVVLTAADPLALARVLGGGREELLVLPDGLRIVNTGVSTADYEVRVPPSVDLIVVVVGDGTSRRLATGERGGRWEISVADRR